MLRLVPDRRHSHLGMDNPSYVGRSWRMSQPYDRLLLTLYSRVTEADWATEVLHEITRATRSRSAAIVAVDLTNSRDSLPAFVGAEAASAISYESRYAAHNPWRPPSGEAQDAGKLRVSDDLLPLSDLKRTLFWEDFLRPMGVAHGVGLVGLRDRAHVASLTLLRDERSGPYRGAELALLGRLAPHWVIACRLRERLGLLTDAERGLADVIDGLATAVLLLDHAGLLVRANAAAEVILAKEDWLAVRRGKPMALHGQGAALLAHAIEMAAKGTSTDALATAVRLTDTDGRSVAHAAAHPVMGGRHGNAVRVALFVQRIEAKTGRSTLLRALRDAYGLTEREAELACLLDGSRSLADAAHVMRITLGSMRTRLKVVCAKMGVRGQTGLLLVMQSLRSAVGSPRR